MAKVLVSDTVLCGALKFFFTISQLLDELLSR